MSKKTNTLELTDGQYMFVFEGLALVLGRFFETFGAQTDYVVVDELVMLAKSMQNKYDELLRDSKLKRKFIEKQDERENILDALLYYPGSKDEKAN